MTPANWIALAGVALSFVGLLITAATGAFHLGRLSQRVDTLEKAAAEDRGLSEKVVRLEVQMENSNKQLEAIHRDMQGIQRQLANIATQKLAAAE